MMSSNNQATVIMSGGMDSATLAYYYKEKGLDLHLVGFNFGQRHSKKLLSLELIAKTLGASWQVINLQRLANNLSHSLITNIDEVVYGHDAKAVRPEIVVPNRNMIMLAIAGGIAVANGSRILAIGVHAGDHFINPDCRPDFIEYLDNALIAGNQGRAVFGFHLDAPFVYTTKADVAKIGSALQVPFELTWSCDKNGKLHCGLCPNCEQRIAAFAEGGVADPTTYKTALQSFSKEIVKAT
jgi:7-cyano-7-deazaguanine synthase